MNKAIEVGDFLLWTDDIEYVQATDDALGYCVVIKLKSGTIIRVDTKSYNATYKLKSDIYHTMVEAQNTNEEVYASGYTTSGNYWWIGTMSGYHEIKL